MSQAEHNPGIYLRRIVAHVTQLSRNARLRRQLTEVEQRAVELPRSYRRQLAELLVRESEQLSASDVPTDWGTQTEDGVTRSGLDVGLERARSENVHVRMRGIVLWLMLVQHDTEVAPGNDSEDLHRQVLRVIRLIKEALPQQPGKLVNGA